MLSGICASTLVLLSLLLGIAIWGSWRSFTGFYEDGIFQRDDEKSIAWLLLHPGWWLLPLVPFKGNDWLKKVLDDDNQDKSLKLPFEEKNRTGEDVDNLKGGDCVLISEYFERDSGLAHGVRLIPVCQASILKSGFDHVKDLAPNEIPVYMARPIEREWADLAYTHMEDTFDLVANRREYVISIFEAGKDRAKLCPHASQYANSNGHHLESGDRFVIDITEFQFLKLPCLALIKSTDEIICEDIEIGYSSPPGFAPRFKITEGKLDVLEAEGLTYSPVKRGRGENEFDFPKDRVLLQPGDRLRIINGDELYIGYAGMEGK